MSVVSDMCPTKFRKRLTVLPLLVEQVSGLLFCPELVQKERQHQLLLVDLDEPFSDLPTASTSTPQQEGVTGVTGKWAVSFPY